MESINSAARVTIFSKYIGNPVVISDTLNNQETIGRLIGIKQNALLVSIDNVSRWVPLSDDIKLSNVKLILKPLKRLTSAIIDTANSLPVQAFITPYYQSLGFDMPVYVAPGHPANCKYLHELGLADYRTPEEIMCSNTLMRVVHA